MPIKLNAISHMMNESVRALSIFCLVAVSVVWFGLGLVAPLTPSYGLPSLWEVLLFVGLPLALIALGFQISKRTIERIFVALPFLFILTVAAWLFTLQAGWFRYGV